METNLIERLGTGQESSFRDIYDLYHYKIFCFVKKYTRQQADAEDVTQNVFIHLWNYRNKLDVNVSLDAVLFKSAKQEISRWYKKQNRVFSVEEKQLIAELDRVDESDETIDEKIEEIKVLLGHVPERRRKIFTLYKFEERTYQEIALEMNMSPSAVANQVSKTLQYLKKNSISQNELYWLVIAFLIQN